VLSSDGDAGLQISVATSDMTRELR
jgi:hypothetical protein